MNPIFCKLYPPPRFSGALPGFTIAQLNAIIDATNSNNQVYWIIDDPDVKEFLSKIIKGKESQLKPEGLSELYSTMKDTPDLVEEDDVPF